MNSTLRYDHQRQNHTNNAATHSSYLFISLITRYKLPFFITLLVVVLTISIVISFLIFKRMRKEKGKLRRNQNVIKRRVRLKPDPSSNFRVTLFTHNDRKAFHHDRIRSAANINSTVTTNLDFGYKLKRGSIGTPNGSLLAATPSRKRSMTYVVSRSSDNDDISDLDLEIISLRRQISSEDNPVKSEVLQVPKNPYVAHFEEQERLQRRKGSWKSLETSDDSSEASCV